MHGQHTPGLGPGVGPAAGAGDGPREGPDNETRGCERKAIRQTIDGNLTSAVPTGLQQSFIMMAKTRPQARWPNRVPHRATPSGRPTWAGSRRGAIEGRRARSWRRSWESNIGAQRTNDKGADDDGTKNKGFFSLHRQRAAHGIKVVGSGLLRGA